MGQEVDKIDFTISDFKLFSDRLGQETELLHELLSQQTFKDTRSVTGYELEAWLVDRNLFPTPLNQEILKSLNNPLVVPELSRFNIELNGTPQELNENALGKLHTELENTLANCQSVAHSHQATMMLIGTLPTLRNCDLCMANITPSNRFNALNKQVLKARKQRAIKLEIYGEENLSVTHHDVMLEAAATSFQIHLQTPPESFVQHFNASILLSAFTVAAGSNSPYLFGYNLWSETRIPLFEQAIAIDNQHRVGFGEGYIQYPDEFFQNNYKRHSILLPILYDSSPEQLKHLRLHNGTVWRWNRPLIDFNAQGLPHFRIEHRVLPAGPSVIDMIANAAFYLGAVNVLAKEYQNSTPPLSFHDSQKNFYQAARHGLAAKIRWFDGYYHSIHRLLLDELIPMAEQGLKSLGIKQDDIDYYLSVFRLRVESRQTGSQWQRDYIAHHGKNFFQMSSEYLHHQQSGMPVHEWEI